VSETVLKGTIIGFEEYQDYMLKDALGPTSPFRVLECAGAPLAFVLVNPFSVTEGYNIEIEDDVLRNLELASDSLKDIAVLCIARRIDPHWCVNLRSPLVFNTEKNKFQQVILQNDSYPVSVPIVFDRNSDE
jgi:flagellar assembly factor FliW